MVPSKDEFESWWNPQTKKREQRPVMFERKYYLAVGYRPHWILRVLPNRNPALVAADEAAAAADGDGGAPPAARRARGPPGRDAIRREQMKLIRMRTADDPMSCGLAASFHEAKLINARAKSERLAIVNKKTTTQGAKTAAELSEREIPTPHHTHEYRFAEFEDMEAFIHQGVQPFYHARQPTNQDKAVPYDDPGRAFMDLHQGEATPEQQNLLVNLSSSLRATGLGPDEFYVHSQSAMNPGRIFCLERSLHYMMHRESGVMWCPHKKTRLLQSYLDGVGDRPVPAAAAAGRRNAQEVEDGEEEDVDPDDAGITPLEQILSFDGSLYYPRQRHCRFPFPKLVWKLNGQATYAELLLSGRIPLPIPIGHRIPASALDLDDDAVDDPMEIDDDDGHGYNENPNIYLPSLFSQEEVQQFLLSTQRLGEMEHNMGLTHFRRHVDGVLRREEQQQRQLELADGPVGVPVVVEPMQNMMDAMDAAGGVGPVHEDEATRARAAADAAAALAALTAQEKEALKEVMKRQKEVVSVALAELAKRYRTRVYLEIDHQARLHKEPSSTDDYMPTQEFMPPFSNEDDGGENGRLTPLEMMRRTLDDMQIMFELTPEEDRTVMSTTDLFAQWLLDRCEVLEHRGRYQGTLPLMSSSYAQFFPVADVTCREIRQRKERLKLEQSEEFKAKSERGQNRAILELSAKHASDRFKAFREKWRQCLEVFKGMTRASPALLSVVSHANSYIWAKAVRQHQDADAVVKPLEYPMRPFDAVQQWKMDYLRSVELVTKSNYPYAERATTFAYHCMRWQFMRQEPALNYTLVGESGTLADILRNNRSDPTMQAPASPLCCSFVIASSLPVWCVTRRMRRRHPTMWTRTLTALPSFIKNIRHRCSSMTVSARTAVPMTSSILPRPG